jgi:hypothetical protein
MKKLCKITHIPTPQIFITRIICAKIRTRFQNFKKNISTRVSRCWVSHILDSSIFKEDFHISIFKKLSYFKPVFFSYFEKNCTKVWKIECACKIQSQDEKLKHDLRLLLFLRQNKFMNVWYILIFEIHGCDNHTHRNHKVDSFCFNITMVRKFYHGTPTM